MRRYKILFGDKERMCMKCTSVQNQSTITQDREYSIVTACKDLENPFDIIGKILEEMPGTSHFKGGNNTTTFENKLENIFAEYGFDSNNYNFRAFGNPQNLNVRIAFNNKEKLFFFSTKELKEHSYRLGNLPNYVKSVLDTIVSKYMTMDDFQFMAVGQNIQLIRVHSKNRDIFYCPKHRRDVHVSKCRLCKYMYDIQPTEVICELHEGDHIIRHNPIHRIKHLNK